MSNKAPFHAAVHSSKAATARRGTPEARAPQPPRGAAGGACRRRRRAGTERAGGLRTDDLAAREAAHGDNHVEGWGWTTQGQTGVAASDVRTGRAGGASSSEEERDGEGDTPAHFAGAVRQLHIRCFQVYTYRPVIGCYLTGLHIWLPSNLDGLNSTCLRLPHVPKIVGKCRWFGARLRRAPPQLSGRRCGTSLPPPVRCGLCQAGVVRLGQVGARLPVLPSRWRTKSSADGHQRAIPFVGTAGLCARIMVAAATAASRWRRLPPPRVPW